MKIQKSLFFSFLLIGLFSLSNLEAGTPIKDNATSISKVFQKYLKNIKLSDYNTTSKTILIDIMFNEKSEIIVLSTSEKSMDETLKRKLNYKTIRIGKGFEYFKKYTVPVTFK